MKASIKKEEIAIQKLYEFPMEQYQPAIRLMDECKGKLVFSGIGKSAHIAQKLAATFSSLGITSFFVHAAESLHGDLGMIEKRDVVILLSNSGNTTEVTCMLPSLKQIGCKSIAYCADKDSFLAKNCDEKVVYPKVEEADAWNLAPTSSTTIAMILGDAIACALSQNRNFQKKDFHRYHPGGSLGIQLEKEGKIEGN